MSTSREALSQLSKDDLIGTIVALEDSLAEAATGLMKEGSAQEYAALKVRYAVLTRQYDGLSRELEINMSKRAECSDKIASLPRLIRWWYKV